VPEPPDVPPPELPALLLDVPLAVELPLPLPLEVDGPAVEVPPPLELLTLPDVPPPLDPPDVAASHAPVTQLSPPPQTTPTQPMSWQPWPDTHTWSGPQVVAEQLWGKQAPAAQLVPDGQVTPRQGSTQPASRHTSPAGHCAVDWHPPSGPTSGRPPEHAAREERRTAGRARAIVRAQ
jgi:hypothetical protein